MSELKLIDTHCHIHESEFLDKFQGRTSDEIYDAAEKDGVDTFVCVGTSLKGSEEAIEMSKKRADCFASIALHPHEVALQDNTKLNKQFEGICDLGREALDTKSAKLVAIGECGLDYYYHESEEVREAQKTLFRRHIDLAKELELPMIFHIREAFDDFFEIIDEFPKIRGVVHSFSAGQKELAGCIDRGLFVGLNGIMTFTKDTEQLEAAKAVPLQNLLLETDAPFLTPAPFRGIMCEPKHVRVTAEFISNLKGVTLEELIRETTKNAQALFGL